MAHQADISWQFKANPSSMTEVLEMGKKAKDEGNKCYKAKNYGKAVGYYRVGISKLRSGRTKKFPVGEDEAKELDTLEVSLNVNTAMCLVKTEEWEEAITAAGQAIRKDPSNTKALLFRARALIASKHRADGKTRARKDLVTALKLDTKNKSIAAELASLDKEMGVGETTSAESLPKKIDNTKTDDGDEKEEENVLRENFRKSANKPLLADNRSTKPKETVAPPPEPTKEEYERHLAWESEMLRRKQESDEASMLYAKKKAEEDMEDEALMNGTSTNKPSTGYKINAEGNKVPVWSREQVVIPTVAPKRVEGTDVGEGSKVDFNRGYQERDVTQWCVNELLGWALSPLAFKLPECGGTMRTKPVSDLRGEALMVGLQGKFDHTFDFNFSVEWEAKIGKPKLVEVDVKGKKQQMFLGIPTFHGKLRVADMGHLQSSEDYDMELIWGGDGPREVAPDKETRLLIVDILSGTGGVIDILRRRLGRFSECYLKEQDPRALLESLKQPGTSAEGALLLESERAEELSGDWMWAEMKELEEMPDDQSKKEVREKCIEGVEPKGTEEPNEPKGDTNFDPLKTPKMLNYLDQLQKDGYAVFLGDGKEDKSVKAEKVEKVEPSFADTMKLKVNELLSQSLPTRADEEASMLEAEEGVTSKKKMKKKKKGKKGKKKQTREDKLDYTRFDTLEDSDEEAQADELIQAAEHYEELQKNPLWATLLEIAGGDGEKALELMKDPEALQARPEIAALFLPDSEAIEEGIFEEDD